MSIIIPRYTQKPLPGAQINWAHPLAQGLKFGTLVSNSYNLVGGERGTPDGTLTEDVRGKFWPGGGSGVLTRITFNGAPLNQSNLSVHAVVYPSGVNDTRVILGGRTVSPANRAMMVTLESNKFRFFNDEGLAVCDSSAISYSAGQRLSYSLSFSTAPVCTQFLNGKNISSGTSTDPINTSHSELQVGFDQANGSIGSDFKFSGVIECVFAWSRLLSLNEHQWLNAEPYAFIQPQTIRRKYFLSSSGVIGSASITQAGNTVSAAGEVAIAGSASLTQTGNTLGATATVDITGSASITQASGAVSASGTVDITGTAAITQASGTVTSTGTVSIVGTSSLTQSDSTVSSAGVVAIAGTSSLTQSPNTLSAEGASGLTASATLTQFPNTLSSTGIVAVVGAGSLTQSPNTLSSTGVVEIAGTANLTQSPDTVSAAASGGTVGDAAIVQANGGMSATGSVAITGVASLTQTGTISAAGTVLLSAAANLTQSPNTISATGFSGDQLREIIVGTVMNLNSTRSIASLNPTRSVRPIVPE